MANPLSIASQAISVALCTRNGESYLLAQLESLIDQTHTPYELLVCDDASEDTTWSLLKENLSLIPFQTRMFRNQCRLGVRANFEQAIRLCTGELVALCDQDDVWLPNKLSRLALGLAVHPDAVATFSDAQIVDSSLAPLGYTMWEYVGLNSSGIRLMLQDRPWDVFFKDPVVTGATLMFRRELLPFILPIPEGWMHDAWIAQIAASQGALVAVPDPLVLYRQHSGNVIGGKKLSFFEQIRRAETIGRLGLAERELKRYSALQERLASFPRTPRCNVMLLMTEAKIAHLEKRAGLSNKRWLRLPVVLREYFNGNYRRFAKDWRNVAADLLMP